MRPACLTSYFVAGKVHEAEFYRLTQDWYIFKYNLYAISLKIHFSWPKSDNILEKLPLYQNAFYDFYYIISFSNMFSLPKCYQAFHFRWCRIYTRSIKTQYWQTAHSNMRHKWFLFGCTLEYSPSDFLYLASVWLFGSLNV